MNQIEKLKSGEIKDLLIKDYFGSKITWNRILDLLYKNADNLQVIDPLWIKIKQRKLFSDMPEIKDFILKLNVDFGYKFIENCSFNDDWDTGECDCYDQWHMDGFVVSIVPKTMAVHQDVHSSCYLQVIGNSFWNLDSQETITMEPGDILFVSQSTTHEVWGEGPRSGILFVEKHTRKN